MPDTHLEANNNIAKVSLIELDAAAPTSFRASSDRGFVLVAIKDCSLLVDGERTKLKAGEYKAIPGRRTLELGRSETPNCPLVLIEIIAASQALTIEKTALGGHKEMEDASDRNSTLLIAISPLQIRDTRNLAEEDGPWKSGPQKSIELHEGQFTWLQRGVHRLRNSGNSTICFVTVEW